MELASGDTPPSWEERFWEYPDVVFATFKLSGGETSKFLQERKLQFGNYVIDLPQMQTTVSWERRQSRSQAPYEPLDWPVVEATLSTNSGVLNHPQGHQLSAGDAPSFVTFDAAAAAFFGFKLQQTGGQLIQGIMFRSQDLRGRIDTVRIGIEAIEVTVYGNKLDELEVEIAGDIPGPSEAIGVKGDEKTTTMNFILIDGLPSGAWVLLRKGSEWIDRRFLTNSYVRGTQVGVEVIVDAGTKLEVLVSSRERQYVEFKRQLPTDNQSKRKIMKTVSAFANGGGGSILLGVDDDRNLVGLDPKSVDQLRDQVTQMIGSWIEPWPPMDFEVLPVVDSEKVVLEIQVGSGSTLYACGQPGEVRTPYVRHHGVTEKASVTEIEAIIRSRTLQSPDLSIFGRG